MLAPLAAFTLMLAGVTTIAMGQDGSRGGAQGRPGGPGREEMASPPAAVVQYAGNNVYLLNGFTLTRHDAQTLKQTGSVTLEAATPPATEGAEGQPPFQPRPFLLTAGEGNAASVIVIAGDTFYRISAKDMKVVVKSTLPAVQRPARQADAQGAREAQRPAPGQGMRGERQGAGGPGGQRGQMGPQGGGMGRGAMMGGPAPEIHNGTLYLHRGGQLLAINTDTGKVTGQLTIRETPPAAAEK